jgi:hypothetical protein
MGSFCLLSAFEEETAPYPEKYQGIPTSVKAPSNILSLSHAWSSWTDQLNMWLPLEVHPTKEALSSIYYRYTDKPPGAVQ